MNMNTNSTLVNLDSIMDKCLSKKMDPIEIINVLEIVFENGITVSDIQKRIDIVTGYQKQLEVLRKLPKIEQRTPEWYAARQTLITASDFAQALGEGKFGTQKQIIKKKCGFEEDNFDNSMPALKWGCMYEDVACAIYAQRNGVKVYDFGLLRHPSIDCVGASPDGINEFGVMVEIKCPWKRKIDGTVPLQYYYQVLGQLDVCGLNECDYFECEFFESDTANGLFEQGVVGFEKGVILEKSDGKFIYSPVSFKATAKELEDWVVSEKETQGVDNVATIHYYILTKCSSIRVYKDIALIEEMYERLKVVWNKILEYRADEELYNKEIKSAPKLNPYKLTGFAFR